METEKTPSGPPNQHPKRASFHKRRGLEINTADAFTVIHGGEDQTDDVTTINGSVNGHSFDNNAEDLVVGQMIRIRDIPGVAWVMWQSGDMMGCELEGPFGSCDGFYDYDQRRYFKTPRNCAHFCAKDQCDYVFEVQAAPRFRYRSHNLNIGDVVMISRETGVGVVKHSTSQLVGCQLNAPVGDSDGQYEGQRYFQTKPNCAFFGHPAHVKKIAAEDLLHKLNETVERLQEIEKDLHVPHLANKS